jgi:hypothetical protein
MTILAPRWLDFSYQAQLQMCPNVAMGNSFFVWAVCRKTPVAFKSTVILGKKKLFRHANLK